MTTRITRSTHLAIATTVIFAPAWLVANRSASNSTEFDFTGRPQDYVVPAGACRIQIEVVGAAGGRAGTSGTPGAGARAIGDFAVASGETLRVRVGGWGGEAVDSTPGAGGWNGGGAGGKALDHGGKAGSGGGGATDVRRGGDSLAHRIIIGAGGAGGAGGAIGGPTGTGGGNGGDPIGHQGFALLGAANPATGGKGATQSAGGAAGRNASDPSVTATAGTLGAGGDGASGVHSGGGGGGGGHYGGGGGGSSSTFSGGHGGGGSSSRPTKTDFQAGVGTGFGQASISYSPC